MSPYVVSSFVVQVVHVVPAPGLPARSAAHQPPGEARADAREGNRRRALAHLFHDGRGGVLGAPCHLRSLVASRADHLLDTADRGFAHRITRLLRQVLRTEPVLQLVDRLAHVLARPLDLLADLLSGSSLATVAAAPVPAEAIVPGETATSRRSAEPTRPQPRRAHAAWDIDCRRVPMR